MNFAAVTEHFFTTVLKIEESNFIIIILKDYLTCILKITFRIHLIKMEYAALTFL